MQEDYKYAYYLYSNLKKDELLTEYKAIFNEDVSDEDLNEKAINFIIDRLTINLVESLQRF